MAGAFITTALAKDYGIFVGGLRVTDSNKNDINPSGKKGGTAWYDSEEKTLYFKDFYMETNAHGIQILQEQEELTICFEGWTMITADCYGIWAECPITLDGLGDGANPQVIIETKTTFPYPAIYFDSEGDLNIWGIYLSATSRNRVAIQGPTDGKYAELWTSCAQIEATSADGQPAVAGFNNWYMQDYAKLTKGTYNLKQKRTVDSEGNDISKVTLMNGLYVCGQMVRADATSSWAVTPEGLTEGTIKYSNKKLTLNNVKFDTDKTFVSNVNVPDLTIECTGTNTINAATGFSLSQNTSFTGSGALYINTTGTAISNATASAGNITVQMRTLMAQGDHYGFYGNGTLTFKKYDGNTSYVFAGNKAANIRAYELVMDGMDIWSSGHYFNEKEKAVCANGSVASSSSLLNGTQFATTDRLTYYNLYVGGTQVSSGNSSYIYSPYFKKGYAMYVRSTNTLTLSDVEFEATGEDAPVGVKVGGDMGDFTISLSGDYQNWKTSNDVFDIRTNTTIGGLCPNVQLTSTKESGISTLGGVAINLCTKGYFGVKGAKYGYWGNNNENEVLTLSKTADDIYAYVFEGDLAPFNALKSLQLDNMDFAYGTEGYYFDSNAGNVVQNGGNAVKGRVDFLSIKEKYPITICGKQLGRLTADNQQALYYVGSPYISSGPKSVMYDPAAKTLTLEDVTIKYDVDGEIINFENDAEVTVNVKGNNSFDASKGSAIELHRQSNITFDGDGSLKLRGKYFGLRISGQNSTATIKGDVQLEATGSSQSIGNNGVGASNETLIIGGNAVVRAWSIDRLGNIVLQGDQKVAQPIGAVVKYVDGRGCGVYASEDSNELARNVVIKPGELLYGIYIAGTQVSESNCDNITNENITDGTVKYDPDTKTLTLDNATIDGVIDFDDNVKVTVVVKGNNSVKTSEVAGIIISNDANVTFEGDGTLDVEGKSIGLASAPSSTVTITGDVLLKAKGFVCGIGGSNFGTLNEKLIIDGNARVEASSIRRLNSITLLNGHMVTEPSGAVIKRDKSDGWGVYVNENSTELAKNVVIGTATPFIKGDVNGDGDVNTADVTAVYAFIISGEESGFTAEIADVNGDGDVNSADVVAIYSIIISGSSDSRKYYELLLEMEE